MASSDPSHPTRIAEKSSSAEVILIVDDDEFFRMALRTILTKTFAGAQILETASLDEAMECLSETGAVTLALFDLAMPGMESAASLRAVRECFPQTLVAVVSASRRRADILLALEAGAHGYIPKSLGIVELAAAIKIARSGAIYVPASLTDLRGTEGEPSRPLAASAPANQPASEVGLTPRQRDVLEHLVEGRSNKEIARALNLGEGTVKVHVAALFRVLGVTSRSAAAAAATRVLLADRS